jgi:putative transcriptional regulator
MSKLGDELIQSLREAAAYMAGEPVDVVVHQVVVPDEPDVRAIRQRFKLSRARFAERFGLDARAVQDWEQGRRRPDRTARVLLRTIERHPEAVEDALRAEVG